MAVDIEEVLIAWGRLYGTDFRHFEDRSLTGDSPLARIVGRPKKDATIGRDGRSRRRLMAAELECCGVRIVPVSFVDPVGGKQTRSHKPDADPRETPVLALVQAAWLALHRLREQEAKALLMHYQRRDLSREQRAKALGLTTRDYRHCVASAREFVHARLERGS